MGVHQSSVFNPLLFTVVTDEIRKDVREGGENELPYDDDLEIAGRKWK